MARPPANWAMGTPLPTPAMTIAFICLVAFLASGLTFFSGFGLGTLLLPAFALFFGIEQAIAMTAVVHLLNGLFKLALVGRHADRAVVFRFGVPALAAALVGAWVLVWLGDVEPVHAYRAFGRGFEVTAIKLAIGLLLVLFALAELLPQSRNFAFPSRWMPIGGVLSGFFGGLAGMQGALRSAFLIRAGLSKQAFIATGAVIAAMIDVARLGVYARDFEHIEWRADALLLAAAVLSAFAGAWLGNRHIEKVTLPWVQRLVAISLFAVALALVAGWI